MNAEDLFIKLEYLTPSGHTLNVEQRSALQSSLLLLKKNCKLAKVVFWGKIFGTNNDYLVAQGYEGHMFGNKKTFCSIDAIDWVQLPEIDLETAAFCDQIFSGFTGDPSAESFVSLPAPETSVDPEPPSEDTSEQNQRDSEDEEEGEEEDADSPRKNFTRKQVITITEEKRLAHVIRQIDGDTSVVPRGAFLRTPTGQVIENPSFKGLNLAEADQLSSYSHLREPQRLPHKSLLEKSKLSKTLDFMDPIDEDLPRGVWGHIRDKVSNLVTIRSLLWPGFFAYHVSGTNNFGYCYFGFGEKNRDIGFML